MLKNEKLQKVLTGDAVKSLSQIIHNHNFVTGFLSYIHLISSLFFCVKIDPCFGSVLMIFVKLLLVLVLMVVMVMLKLIRKTLLQSLSLEEKFKNKTKEERRNGIIFEESKRCCKVIL